MDDQPKIPRRERRARDAKLQQALPPAMRRAFKGHRRLHSASYVMGAAGTARDLEESDRRLAELVAEQKAKDEAERAALEQATPPIWLAWMLMWAGAATRRRDVAV
jgi:hypothetical protein